ncbi:MAG: Holliday junction resolvase RuvX [Steroidobacteraceae bacterium]|jgi:putative Holliday junction resolvase
MSPATPELVLGLDFGLRRIGLAIGDSLTRTARPLAAFSVTGHNGPDTADWQRLGTLIKQHAPNRLVVGCPYNVDGSEHALTGKARRFAQELGERYALPVELVDERYSSLEAEAALRERRGAGQRGRIDRGSIDSAAAAIILERWFS